MDFSITRQTGSQIWNIMAYLHHVPSLRRVGTWNCCCFTSTLILEVTVLLPPFKTCRDANIHTHLPLGTKEWHPTFRFRCLPKNKQGQTVPLSEGWPAVCLEKKKWLPGRTYALMGVHWDIISYFKWCLTQQLRWLHSAWTLIQRQHADCSQEKQRPYESPWKWLKTLH